MNTRFVAYAAIVLGGALAGALFGHAGGPEFLSVSADSSSMMGAGVGALLSALGCCGAVEWSVARARNRATVEAMERRLTRLVAALVRVQ